MLVRLRTVFCTPVSFTQWSSVIAWLKITCFRHAARCGLLLQERLKSLDIKGMVCVEMKQQKLWLHARDIKKSFAEKYSKTKCPNDKCARFVYAPPIRRNVADADTRTNACWVCEIYPCYVTKNNFIPDAFKITSPGKQATSVIIRRLYSDRTFNTRHGANLRDRTGVRDPVGSPAHTKQGFTAGGVLQNITAV